MTKQDRIKLVCKLANVKPQHIRLHEDGFLSSAYVIKKGEIVFKFPKWDFVRYNNEVNSLNFVASLNPNVNLQKVKWIDSNFRYIGFYGVVGKSLRDLDYFNDEQKKDIGRQLGQFVRLLHNSKPQYEIKDSEARPLELGTCSSIKGNLPKKCRASLEYFARCFTDIELRIIQSKVEQKLYELKALGEKLVYSHSDLNVGNIFVDDNGMVGIIDFDGCGYYDESLDFVEMIDEVIFNEMLDVYGADEVLRKKVKLRKDLWCVVVAKDFVQSRGEQEMTRFTNKIRKQFL